MPRKKRHSRAVSLDAELIVLAVDANFEFVTKMGFDYRQANTYPLLEKKGFKLQRCQGALARRTYIAPEARKPGVVYITGVGHGSFDSYTGDFFDPIFTVGNYSQEESQGKIAHFISCETGRDLGPDFVLHGCRAYFGYDENFSFQPDDADIFFRCDTEIDRGLAEGLTAGQVYDRAQAIFDQQIAEFRAAGKDFKAATLEFDRDHLRGPSSGAQWGDVDARLI
jgi:hypothetical protein